MEEELKLEKEAIEISGSRKMRLYTFELDGVQMPEMRKEDIVPTVHQEQPENSQG